MDAFAGPPESFPGRWYLSLSQWWAITGAILGLYLFAWWLHLRPGVFSYDSGFYLNEVRAGNLSNLKPFLYARFLQIATLNGRALQLASVVQALLVLLALSRMFAIAMVTRARIASVVACALVVLNPYVANMVFYVQNDILFSVAVVAITVETLYIARQGRLSISSCAMITLFAPMALLFRQNGIAFLPLWAAAMFLLVPRREWLRVVLPATIACVVAFASVAGVSTEGPVDHQDMLYPAVIHEVVGLARPAFHDEIGARLSPETQVQIGSERMKHAVEFYAPLYWDTIAFFPGGPMLVQLPAEQRSRIVRSFLRHDLLPNVQTVLAHRLEIFLGASLARASMVGSYDIPSNLPQDLAASKSRHAAIGQTGLLHRLDAWSMETRAWGWNALFGVCVLAMLSLAGLWRRDVPLLLCTLLFWVQAGLILIAAPSAEYRYVFALYLAPLLLLVGSALSRPFRHLAHAGPTMIDADACDRSNLQGLRRE
jgi:hypothetical protein